MPGGGRGARHVEPHHLVNLTLVLLAFDPMTHAAEAVALYRHLVWEDPAAQTQPLDVMYRSPDRRFMVEFKRTRSDFCEEELEVQSVMMAEALRGRRTFGAALDSMVQRFAYGAVSQQKIIHPNGIVAMRTCADTAPSASIAWASSEGCQIHKYSTGRRSLANEHHKGRLPGGPHLDRTTTVGAELIGVLSDLWRDTMSYQRGERRRTRPNQLALES
jgi:hypothetical protein